MLTETSPNGPTPQPPQAAAPEAPTVDLQALAEIILAMIKRDLRLEKERGAGRESGVYR